jgi:hypothetical protein
MCLMQGNVVDTTVLFRDFRNVPVGFSTGLTACGELDERTRLDEVITLGLRHLDVMELGGGILDDDEMPVSMLVVQALIDHPARDRLTLGRAIQGQLVHARLHAALIEPLDNVVLLPRLRQSLLIALLELVDAGGMLRGEARR